MLEDIVKERIKKLNNFKKAGINPYPAKAGRTHLAGELLSDFERILKAKKQVTIAGRIIGLRLQGGLMFFDVRDESGRIQAVAKKESVGNYAVFSGNLDVGDFVECGGLLFKTKKGEKSVEVKKLKLLVKNLTPLPDKWAGLEDVEIRFRRRYLDFLLRGEVKEMFIKKSIFWNACRSYLIKNNFIEVETPVLEAVPGGADAEPFITHHNALNADFYLRISPELALKKILVGGFEKIFEIGRVFRNEGIDHEHLQDYTQCEFYWAYSDYRKLMDFAEDMYKTIIKATTGGLKTKWREQSVDWGKKWPRHDYYQLFKERVGLDLTKTSIKDLKNKADKSKIDYEPNLGKGRLIDLLYKKLVRPFLVQPSFLINPPADIEPLAKRMEEDPNRVERIQVLACGTELGKGFSEANDPLDQRKRFEEQMRLREGGDKEAQRIDEEFLLALEYGMPPAAGFGFSERLFAILMDKPVREAVIFPLMRPSGKKL